MIDTLVETLGWRGMLTHNFHRQVEGRPITLSSPRVADQLSIDEASGRKIGKNRIQESHDTPVLLRVTSVHLTAIVGEKYCQLPELRLVRVNRSGVVCYTTPGRRLQRRYIVLAVA